MNISDYGRVIAAVKSDDAFNKALNTNVKTIFDLSPDLLSLSKRISAAGEAGKKYFVHIDLATGIGKDKSGVVFIKKTGADGIISTRSNIIKFAKESELPAVQRFFIVDSKSLETAVETVNSLKPDFVEIMPGTGVKAISVIKSRVSVPLIAGGLIETPDEINAAISSGAFSVSTGKLDLW